MTIPGGTHPGPYFLIAKADGAGTVVESNEKNNTRARAIKLGPDLTISVSTSSTVQAGSTITIRDTTKNAAAGGPAGASTARFYLSSDGTFNAGDQLLGSRAVPALAAGASSSGSTAAVVPAGTTAGSYYIIAVADADDAVAEANEGNNTRKKAVSVQ